MEAYYENSGLKCTLTHHNKHLDVSEWITVQTYIIIGRRMYVPVYNTVYLFDIVKTYWRQSLIRNCSALEVNINELHR